MRGAVEVLLTEVFGDTERSITKVSCRPQVLCVCSVGTWQLLMMCLFAVGSVLKCALGSPRGRKRRFVFLAQCML